MKKSSFVALILGTIGCVFFALGMCMCLIQEWGVARQGIVCGVAGLAILLAGLLIWRKMEGKAPIVISPRTLGLAALGVAGALLLGVGMCLSMNVIGNGSSVSFVLGVIIGLVGLAGMGINYPVYKKMLARGKQKYAFEIMELAKEISGE